MEVSKPNLEATSAVCLFVNGLIFVFYAISIPALIHGVHWLITLAAALFIVALPAIYQYLGRIHKGAANAAKAAIGLFGMGMVLIVASDVMFVSSSLPRLTHDLVYVFGNALFVISLFAIGALAWKRGFPKWLGVLSIVTGIIGVLTYVPGAFVVIVPSLLLLGAWSFTMAFALRTSK